MSFGVLSIKGSKPAPPRDAGRYRVDHSGSAGLSASEIAMRIKAKNDATSSIVSRLTKGSTPAKANPPRLVAHARNDYHDLGLAPPLAAPVHTGAATTQKEKKADTSRRVDPSQTKTKPSEIGGGGAGRLVAIGATTTSVLRALLAQTVTRPTASGITISEVGVRFGAPSVLPSISPPVPVPAVVMALPPPTGGFNVFGPNSMPSIGPNSGSSRPRMQAPVPDPYDPWGRPGAGVRPVRVLSGAGQSPTHLSIPGQLTSVTLFNNTATPSKIPPPVVAATATWDPWGKPGAGVGPQRGNSRQPDAQTPIHVYHQPNFEPPVSAIPAAVTAISSWTDNLGAVNAAPATGRRRAPGAAMAELTGNASVPVLAATPQKKQSSDALEKSRQELMASPEMQAVTNAMLAKTGTLMMTADFEARMKQEKKAEHQRLVAEQITLRAVEKKRLADEEKRADAALEARIAKDNDLQRQRHLDELDSKNAAKLPKKAVVTGPPAEHDPNMFKSKIAKEDLGAPPLHHGSPVIPDLVQPGAEPVHAKNSVRRSLPKDTLLPLLNDTELQNESPLGSRSPVKYAAFNQDPSHEHKPKSIQARAVNDTETWPGNSPVTPARKVAIAPVHTINSKEEVEHFHGDRVKSGRERTAAKLAAINAAAKLADKATAKPATGRLAKQILQDRRKSIVDAAPSDAPLRRALATIAEEHPQKAGNKSKPKSPKMSPKPPSGPKPPKSTNGVPRYYTLPRNVATGNAIDSHASVATAAPFVSAARKHGDRSEEPSRSSQPPVVAPPASPPIPTHRKKISGSPTPFTTERLRSPQPVVATSPVLPVALPVSRLQQPKSRGLPPSTASITTPPIVLAPTYQTPSQQHIYTQPAPPASPPIPTLRKKMSKVEALTATSAVVDGPSPVVYLPHVPEHEHRHTQQRDNPHSMQQSPLQEQHFRPQEQQQQEQLQFPEHQENHPEQHVPPTILPAPVPGLSSQESLTIGDQLAGVRQMLLQRKQQLAAELDSTQRLEHQQDKIFVANEVARRVARSVWLRESLGSPK